jgi:hypothetical protein
MKHLQPRELEEKRRNQRHQHLLMDQLEQMLRLLGVLKGRHRLEGRLQLLELMERRHQLGEHHPLLELMGRRLPEVQLPFLSPFPFRHVFHPYDVHHPSSPPEQRQACHQQ